MADENENERDDDRHDDVNDRPDGRDGANTDEQIEARARKQGWRPESEWDEARAEREGRRKPSRFMTAREFLDKTENELPVMRERMRRHEQTNQRLEKDLAEIKKQNSELSDLLKTQHNMSLEAKKRAYEKGLAEARAEMRAAVKEGDEARHDAAVARVEELQAEQRELEQATARTEETHDEDPEPKPKSGKKTDDDTGGDEDAYLDKLDSETRAWCVENSKWFRSDASLNAYMVKMNGVVRQEHPDWSITDQLNEAKARTMDKFPEEFGRNPARNGKGAVSHPSGGDGGADKSTKKFDALPADAKQAYERFRKQFEARNPKEKYTKEMYLADYHE